MTLTIVNNGYKTKISSSLSAAETIEHIRKMRSGEFVNSEVDTENFRKIIQAAKLEGKEVVFFYGLGGALVDFRLTKKGFRCEDSTGRRHYFYKNNPYKFLLGAVKIK